MSITTKTAERPRWILDDFLESGDQPFDKHPDEAWYLGGADNGDDEDSEYDLWLLRFDDADEPDQDPEYQVLALQRDSDDDWIELSEDCSTVDYRSCAIIQEAMRRAVAEGYVTAEDDDDFLFDQRRNEGSQRSHIPEDPDSSGLKRNHREDALYLGMVIGEAAIPSEAYLVPRMQQYSGHTDTENAARVYTVHQHGCGTVDAWWEDSSVPNGRSYTGIRKALRLVHELGFDFDFSDADMHKYDDRDGITANQLPAHQPSNPQPVPVQQTSNEETQPMSTKVNIQETGKKFNHVTVTVSADEQIHLPEGMSSASARKWLETIEKAEEQVVSWSETIDAYPLDGAIALNKVLERRFGGAVKTGATRMTWFGEIDIPPFMVQIETGVGRTEHVPWGHFIVPTMPEHKIQAGIDYKAGQLFFQLSGDIKKKYQPLMDAIANQVREELKTGSIYKGQAFRITFPTTDEMESRNYNPHDYAPTFMNVAEQSDQLIFSAAVQEQIDTNLFAPVRYTESCRKHGIPLKRGVLLAGKYGTGKTLTSFVLSRLCVENGWTFVYLKNVADLEKAMRFAKRYEPAVIFAEDIDSVMQQKDGSARDAAMNQILNTIDGVDMKRSEQLVVLTSNFVERINKGMLRPGRLDAVIIVEAPDALAAIRLFRHYAHGLLDHETDASLMAAAELMAGQIPSVIREVVERSKLAAIHRSSLTGTTMSELKGSDMLIAAHGIAAHIKLLEDPPVDKRSDVEKAAQIIADTAAGRLTNGSSKHTASALPAKPKELSGVSES